MPDIRSLRVRTATAKPVKPAKPSKGKGKGK